MGGFKSPIFNFYNMLGGCDRDLVDFPPDVADNINTTKVDDL
jgi:hypothetical protein